MRTGFGGRFRGLCSKYTKTVALDKSVRWHGTTLPILKRIRKRFALGAYIGVLERSRNRENNFIDACMGVRGLRPNRRVQFTLLRSTTLSLACSHKELAVPLGTGHFLLCFSSGAPRLAPQTKVSVPRLPLCCLCRCVYEWGCFIATHGTNSLDRIRVCVSWLCCSSAFQVRAEHVKKCFQNFGLFLKIMCYSLRRFVARPETTGNAMMSRYTVVLSFLPGVTLVQP